MSLETHATESTEMVYGIVLVLPLFQAKFKSGQPLVGWQLLEPLDWPGGTKLTLLLEIAVAAMF